MPATFPLARPPFPHKHKHNNVRRIPRLPPPLSRLHDPTFPRSHRSHAPPPSEPGYFPDGDGGKMWTDDSTTAFADFNAALPAVTETWDSPALQIRSVVVTQDTSSGGSVSRK